MLSLIIAAVFSFLTNFILMACWPGHLGWTITFAVIVFLAIWIAINYKINKRLEAIVKKAIDGITTVQGQVKREIAMYQQRGQAGKSIQEKEEAKLKAATREAIRVLDEEVPSLKKWNFLAARQADTMKAQLYYQLKDYENADPLLEKAIAFDPMIVAMKMARKYKKDDMPAVEKLFSTAKKRFKGDKLTIIYALYAWILVKQQKIDEAVVILDEAKLKTDNVVLKENWEHLANGRLKRFSYAGLGDMWYSLNLEEPKQVFVRQQQQQRFFR